MKDNQIQIKVGDKFFILKTFESEAHNTPTKADLEKLLTLVKELQTKLADKDIQSLQDSKNHGIISSVDRIEFSNGASIQAIRDELILINHDGHIKTRLG